MPSITGGGESLRFGSACRTERRGEDGGELRRQLSDSRVFVGGGG